MGSREQLGRQRSRSSALPVAGILVSGFIPVIGVVFAGWSVGALVVLYWLGMAISGVETAVKVLFAADAERDDDQITPRPTTSETGKFRPRRENARRMGTFLGEYGFAWAIYGVFVSLIFIAMDPAAIGAVTELWFVLALCGSLISSGLTLAVDYAGTNEYRTATPDEVAQTAFNEAFAFFLGLVFGVSLVVVLGSPLAGLLCLAVGKTLYDLSVYTRTRSKRKAPA